MEKEFQKRIVIPDFLSPIRIGFLYLLIPFLVFSLGYIKLIYSIPIVVFLAWAAVRCWKNSKNDSIFSFKSKKNLLIGSIILLCWVFLSGIGGYAFQNPDFHGRNAIFRDLVTMDWPVIYTYPGRDISSGYGFTYYIGYWLPSAFLGKLFGWEMANFALFIWTFIGVQLAAILLMKKTGLSFIHSALLLIFFSGMDFLGVIATRGFHSDMYPNIWPPIQHLEWWSPGMQFSSFTTQLFWVFNQAVPAWICLLVAINLTSKKFIFLLLALCVFLSPIPALGFLPIVLFYGFANINRDELSVDQLRKAGEKKFSRKIIKDFREMFTIENVLGGGLILIVSILYYYSSSSNVPRQISAIRIENVYFMILYLIFSLFEWMLLWLVLLDQYKKNALFYIIAVLLISAPLLFLSDYFVISKRATIPMLLMLMVWCGRYLNHRLDRRRVLIIFILIIGSFTPLYEINRSIYRTFVYYFQNQDSSGVNGSLYTPNSDLPEFPDKPELDHPGELVADKYYTMSVFKPEQLGTKIGPVSKSIFYRYLAK